MLQTGFEAGASGACVDVDECADYDSACAAGQRCENTMGSFRCVGECELGLRMDPVSISKRAFAALGSIKYDVRIGGGHGKVGIVREVA